LAAIRGADRRERGAGEGAHRRLSSAWRRARSGGIWVAAVERGAVSPQARVPDVELLAGICYDPVTSSLQDRQILRSRLYRAVFQPIHVGTCVRCTTPITRVTWPRRWS